jgi:nitronate monooxygenase
MFSLNSLTVPIIAAPMAGGPSTPELVTAVSSVGGTGFLAAGYKSAAAVEDEIDAVRSRTDAPFGVNVFVPGSANVSPHDDGALSPERRSSLLAAYRQSLAADAERYHVDLPQTDAADTDGWDAKIELLVRKRVPMVSFTFGCPDRSVISRLRDAGTCVVVSVTNVPEAMTSLAQGADALCVQGPLGGGHRPTHSVSNVPGNDDLTALVSNLRAAVDLPIIAAGGISRPEHVASALEAGAVAVQMGTVFLRCPESGASALHKEALASGAFDGTTATRAFSGRVARALTNRFIRDHDQSAPAIYPEVNQLTRPLRAAAQNAHDPGGISLWAGTNYRDATSEPAATIVQRVWDATLALATEPILRDGDA